MQKDVRWALPAQVRTGETLKSIAEGGSLHSETVVLGPPHW